MPLFQIHHYLDYHYSQVVPLTPHLLRLRPRSDVNQHLLEYSLKILPQPSGNSDLVDLDGNPVQKLWFNTPTDHLSIVIQSLVQTQLTNPFNFLLAGWAVKLPFDYPSSLMWSLQPYLRGTLPNGEFEPRTLQLAQEIAHLTHGNPVNFLTALNQHLNEAIRYEIREHGDPFLPGWTLSQQSGSCRDIAIVFMEACRAMGLASRFVSGYHVGDVEAEIYDLHAWVEVYLPGAGWRGYDPTVGEAVAQNHIPIAAGALPLQAAPLEGSFIGQGVDARLSYKVQIEVLEDHLSAN
jgi:transglutaminase-like putative cysteine protease